MDDDEREFDEREFWRQAYIAALEWGDDSAKAQRKAHQALADYRALLAPPTEGSEDPRAKSYLEGWEDALRDAAGKPLLYQDQ